MTELVKTYYNNVTLNEQYTLVNGVREGLYQRWYENGQKYIEYTYVSGECEGLYQRWYESGQLWYKCTFVGGKRHGLVQRLYDNTFIAGDLNGPTEYLIDNGKKYIECTFIADRLHGWFSSWNLDGSLKKIEFFRDDERIDFQVLAKEQLNIFMEELMATIYHPDRLERIAKRYNMDAMDYLEYLN